MDLGTSVVIAIVVVAAMYWLYRSTPPAQGGTPGQQPESDAPVTPPGNPKLPSRLEP